MSETHRAASGTFCAAAVSTGRDREHPAASKGPDFLAVFASPGRPMGTPPGCSPAQNPIRTSLHLLVYLCLADLSLSLCDDSEEFRSEPIASKSQVPTQICIGYALSFAEKSPGSSCSSISFLFFFPPVVLH